MFQSLTEMASKIHLEELGKLDGVTREELYLAREEFRGQSEAALSESISHNNMLRAETKKYHSMRRKIEKNARCRGPPTQV